MKKVLAGLLAIMLTAAVSIGATLAYLTDTDEDVNVMTLGQVKIDQLEYERVDTETENDEADVQEFHDNKPLLPAVTKDGFDYTPGDSYVDWAQIGKDGYTSDIWDPEQINNEVDKMVFVKNKGDYDAYVRSVFAFEAGKYTTLDEFKKMVHLNLNETDYTWEWVKTPVAIPNADGTETTNYFVATATYNKVLEPGKLTEISLGQIALDSSATNEDVAAFGDTYQVLVKSQGIQSQGFTDADTALNEGFGVVDVNNVPWETDSAIQGIDLRTALHYYEGDKTNKITAKVANVYFDLNSEYPDIAAGEGTLVDVEQDVDVYAYYVPNGSNYDVYFLADDTIYTPKDSTELFRDMTALQKVDTVNLDVSRTEIMFRMFQSCSKLTEMDTSHWDTSGVNTMGRMFQSCAKLPALDVPGWDVSNVTDMYCTFGGCSALKTLDVRNWDVSNVTDMAYIFWNATSLQNLDTTKWDVGNVTTMMAAFYNCYVLESIGDTRNWDTSSVTTLEVMFQNCRKLKELDVSQWDLSSTTSLKQTFYDCRSLQALQVGQWDVSNVTKMEFTFGNCISLPELDVKNWDTGKVTTFKGMFTSITSNAGDMKFTKLEVENWDMSSAVDISSMFYGCGYLTELDLSKWDVSNVTNMYHMFADCFQMVDYNFSGWDTSKLTTMDGIFNSNRALQVVDLSDFDTQNVEDFDQTFDGCSNLQQIIGLDHWDTSSGMYFQQFLTGTKVREMDLSSFNMTNAKRTDNMFSGNSELTTIYASENWNLDQAQLKGSAGMFGGNAKLTGANGTTISGNPTDATYGRIDTAETPGYLTYKAAPTANP